MQASCDGASKNIDAASSEYREIGAFIAGES